MVSEKKSVMSKNHCARTSFWWVRACAPYLWFMQLPNWHFYFTYHLFNALGICAVENFQRFIFGSLPTSSQEKVKLESTFTFTFKLCTIYEVNFIAQYLESCWPATNNDAILTLYVIKTLSLTLSTFCMASNKLIHQTISPSIHWSIHQLINRFIGQSIHW